MSLEDLGNIGEFVAAVAVVLSLIYLAVQIRQNTRSVRMASHHAVMSEFRTNVRVLTQDPELASAYQVGLEHPDQLSETDRARFGPMLASSVQIYEELYAHYRAGLIERDLWESRQRNLFYLMSLPGPLAWWRGEATYMPGRRGSDQVSEDFRRLIEDQISTFDAAVSREEQAASQEDAGEST
jgi:hypothetical protein